MFQVFRKKCKNKVIQKNSDQVRIVDVLAMERFGINYYQVRYEEKGGATYCTVVPRDFSLPERGDWISKKELFSQCAIVLQMIRDGLGE